MTNHIKPAQTPPFPYEAGAYYIHTPDELTFKRQLDTVASASAQTHLLQVGSWLRANVAA